MMVEFIRKNGPLGWFAASFLILVIGFSAYYVRLAETENLIILHFMAGRGADVLGTAGDALGMLVSGGMILVANGMLAAILASRNRALANAIGMLTVLIVLLILIAILGIIAVN